MISIIMPTYNRAYIIERAIQSVIQQTYKDWELIIVDDASDDHTKDVVMKYLSYNIQYYVNSINKGANLSRNIGVQYSKGEYLAFLDSDNYWPKERLELQLKIVKEHCNKRCFFYGKVKILDEKNEQTVPNKNLTWNELKKIELYDNVVDMNTIMISKSLFLESGGFDNEMPRLQDWEFVLRLLYVLQIEGIGCESCLSFNEIQENSIGRDHSKFEKAIFILYKKYMCKYMKTGDLFHYLYRFMYNPKLEKDQIQRIISKMALKNPDLLFVTLEQLQEKENETNQNYDMENLLYLWHMKNLESNEGTLFSKYFNKDSDLKTIAIYGLGKLGTLFYNEIKRLPVHIKYGIDREKKSFDSIIIKRVDEKLDDVDCVVVAILKNCKHIKEQLEEIYPGRVVTLIDLIRGEGA
ncbi:glycosyltransferase family 2 protein [Candidatus Ventrimonas sp. KK005]|nr:glycosyltransferase family 2 protein [Lachnospiraceae bacterium]